MSRCRSIRNGATTVIPRRRRIVALVVALMAIGIFIPQNNGVSQPGRYAAGLVGSSAVIVHADDGDATATQTPDVGATQTADAAAQATAAQQTADAAAQATAAQQTADAAAQATATEQTAEAQATAAQQTVDAVAQATA